MPTALFISPHLDDASFSCGGLAALLADAGWRTVLATVFTATVLPVTGFALECQLDKGLAANVDYMALRRAEDAEAAAILGFAETVWLDLPEAPHRGYNSAAALFGAIGAQDTILRELTASLLKLAGRIEPDLTLAPQALGSHVDHQSVVAAMQHIGDPDDRAYYRDAPYAIRDPDATPAPEVPCAPVVTVPIEAAMARKVAAAQAYASQVGFQFKGTDALDHALRAFAIQEGDGVPAERFISSSAYLESFAA